MADSPRPILSHTDASGRAAMVDVGGKPATDRRATAEGSVWVGAQVAEAIRADTLAKGDLLAVARLGGVQAAKRAADLVLLCHTIELAHVSVEAWVEGETVLLRASVRASGQTGVEMEALAAVAGAALNVVDMAKGLNPGSTIQSLRVVEKTGGKSGPAAVRPLEPPPRFAVLTVSDRRSRGEEPDLAGPALAREATELFGAEVCAAGCIPDDRAEIERVLRAWIALAPPPDVVLTTGGTGLAPRDVTPEATAAVIERPAPGLLDVARLRLAAGKPFALLSRALCGVAGRTIVLNLPGSPRGACETLRLMADVLPHAIETLRGSDGPHPQQ